jgi:hypothetical protein
MIITHKYHDTIDLNKYVWLSYCSVIKKEERERDPKFIIFKYTHTCVVI